MNEPNVPSAFDPKKFEAMLAQPPLLPDPVFPAASYLADFSMNYFQMLLRHWQRPELVSQIAASGGTRQMVMLRVGWLAFWAFDFEAKSERGVSGRDEFLDRVKEQIRRPPPHMAAFTMEQHLVARGVLKIQIGGGDSVPGQSMKYANRKTLGWRGATGLLTQGFETERWFCDQRFFLKKGVIHQGWVR